jgi:hypothetical protein
MNFSGPGGGDFAGRFAAYVEGVQNRISSNWLQSTVDASVRWAPRAMFTVSALPSNYSGSSVTVEFWFDFRR